MMALLRSSLLLAFIASPLVPAIAGAQWTVKVYSTMNPLPIGVCAAVRLELLDPETRDVPRRPGGERVTIADFDIVVGGGSVAPQWIDAYHLNACACQSGAVGSNAVVTATYPAAALPEQARVAGVSVQAKGDFSLGKAQNISNPPSCTTASVAPRVVVAAAAVKPVIAPARTTTPTPFSAK